MPRRQLLSALVVAGLVALAPGGVSGQSPVPVDPGRLELTRDDLTRLLAELQEVAASPAYGSGIRDRARQDIQAVEERLAQGDFRAGDRVVLAVDGRPELSDTLIVEPGPRITIPSLGPVELEGVLRSELRSHLTTEIGRYFRDPSVQAESLIRISIQGMVENPGFYTVPANVLLSDALMQAGGPDRAADLDELRIERSGNILWDGELLQEMLVAGRTLDQLNLRAGDQIVLPERRASLLFEIARYGAIIVSTIFLGTRVF